MKHITDLIMANHCTFYFYSNTLETSPVSIELLKYLYTVYSTHDEDDSTDLIRLDAMTLH